MNTSFYEESINMPSSDARTRAVAKYNKAKYEQVVVRTPKGYRDSVLRVVSNMEGVSINEYILSAVSEKIERDHPGIEGASAWKISKS